MAELLIWDIETGPLPEEELKEVYQPFAFDPPPGPFDPASVKLGNTKQKDLIDAKTEEAAKKHDELLRNYGADCEKKAAANWAAFIDKAALSAVTGRVLAIGVMGQNNKHRIFDDADEAELISKFWQATDYGVRHPTYIGFNIEEFDLPFLARRSWKLGLEVPNWAMPEGGRWFGKHIIDLRKRWQWGNPREQTGKLEDICQFLGVEGKLKGADGESLGKLFYEIWENDRDLAREYLVQDLKCTRDVAKKMRVI